MSLESVNKKGHVSGSQSVDGIDTHAVLKSRSHSKSASMSETDSLKKPEIIVKTSSQALHDISQILPTSSFSLINHKAVISSGILSGDTTSQKLHEDESHEVSHEQSLTESAPPPKKLSSLRSKTDDVDNPHGFSEERLMITKYPEKTESFSEERMMISKPPEESESYSEERIMISKMPEKKAQELSDSRMVISKILEPKQRTQEEENEDLYTEPKVKNTRGNSESEISIPPLTKMDSLYDEPPKLTKMDSLYDEPPKLTKMDSLYDEPPKLTKMDSLYDEPPKLTKMDSLYDEPPKLTKMDSLYDEPPKLTKMDSLYDEPPKLTKMDSLYDEPPKLTKQDSIEEMYQEPKLKRSDSIEEMYQEPKLKRSDSIEEMYQEPKLKRSDSIEEMYQEPKLKRSDSIEEMYQEPKLKRSDSIEEMYQEPKLKRSDSIEEMYQEPKLKRSDSIEEMYQEPKLKRSDSIYDKPPAAFTKGFSITELPLIHDENLENNEGPMYPPPIRQSSVSSSDFESVISSTITLNDNVSEHSQKISGEPDIHHEENNQIEGHGEIRGEADHVMEDEIHQPIVIPPQYPTPKGKIESKFDEDQPGS